MEGIKPNKAAGPDQIPCQILKELATELAPALTSFFQQSLHNGDLPSNWLTAWVAPIFKKGPQSEPANYRPVSLTCITCKMLEHIICSHIRAHMDKHRILTSFNNGFRSKHSCESQLLLTTHDLLTRMDRREQVDVVVLDFSKAFDTVPHLRLLRKLELLGIHGELLTWIRSFLSARTQRVMIEGCHSKAHSVDSGVPQGTVLGPLLFLCFINDLPSVIDPHKSVRLFADDCLLYRSIRSMSDKVQLQCDLDALSKWGDCWGMHFNVNKCHIMQIANSTGPRFYELKNVVLSEVKTAKYLGVLLSCDLSWSPHIASIVSQAHQRLSFLQRNLRESPFRYRGTAYQSLVRSQLEYCCTIWDPTLKGEIEQIERVQRQAARWAKGAYGMTSVTRLLKELGWQDLADRRRHHRLILLYKILNCHISVPPDEVSLVRAARPTRRTSRSSNPTKLQRPHASHKSSPLWKSPIFRSIPEWNSLPANFGFPQHAEALQRFRSYPPVLLALNTQSLGTDV